MGFNPRRKIIGRIMLSHDARRILEVPESRNPSFANTILLGFPLNDCGNDALPISLSLVGLARLWREGWGSGVPLSPPPTEGEG